MSGNHSVDALVNYRYSGFLDWASGYDNQWNWYLADNSSKEERDFITGLINEIDDLIEPDFDYVTSPYLSDLTYFSASSGALNNWGVASNILGQASWNPFSPFPITAWWRNDEPELTEIEKYVISHEVLHTLGLGHPEGEGANPFFDSGDTVMSYNFNGVYDGLSELDIDSLQHLWGAETDPLVCGG